jgi:arsenite methyltransferase
MSQSGRTLVPSDPEQVVSQVRERYGVVAKNGSGCCGPGTCGTTVQLGYDASSLKTVPAEADLGLGCGAPIGALELRAGETVLDLGSGGGLDALLAAREVGPTGRVIGVDMTPEMLARARRAAAKTPNVEFREGRLEALPVEDASVDAVTSNCVINLVPDKGRVFREVARVLRPGGRMVVSDIILDRPLPAALANDLAAYVGCLAGALTREEYTAMIRGAGLENVEVIRDFDYLSSWPKEEVDALLAPYGVERAEVEGVVRSLTFRAVKISG